MKKSNLIIIILIVIAIIYFLVRKKKLNDEKQIEPNNNNLTMANFPYKKTGKPFTKNFKISEFDCNDGTKVPVEYYGNVQKLMEQLQVIREYFKLPITINSGYRTPAYNAKLNGSATNSQHLYAKAADIVILGVTPAKVREGILYLIAQGKIINGGLGSYKTFTHYDIGPARQWKL